MNKSIRTFIGAKNYDESRFFYKELGFEELILSDKMCYFRIDDKLGFYLQRAYIKDWVDNSMLFLEVADVEAYLIKIKELDLPSKYEKCRLSDIVENDWGKEFFLHDPSGILWHIGCFY